MNHSNCAPIHFLSSAADNCLHTRVSLSFAVVVSRQATDLVNGLSDKNPLARSLANVLLYSRIPSYVVVERYTTLSIHAYPPHWPCSPCIEDTTRTY